MALSFLSMFVLIALAALLTLLFVPRRRMLLLKMAAFFGLGIFAMMFLVGSWASFRQRPVTEARLEFSADTYEQVARDLRQQINAEAQSERLSGLLKDRSERAVRRLSEIGESAKFDLLIDDEEISATIQKVLPSPVAPVPPVEPAVSEEIANRVQSHVATQLELAGIEASRIDSNDLRRALEHADSGHSDDDEALAKSDSAPEESAPEELAPSAAYEDAAEQADASPTFTMDDLKAMAEAVSEAIATRIREHSDGQAKASDPPDSIQHSHSRNASPFHSHDSSQPAWVANHPTTVDGRFAVVLTSDPHISRYECIHHIRELTEATVGEYAKELAEIHGLNLRAANDLDINAMDLSSVVSERHYEPLDTSMGEMTQLYQLTVLDDKMETLLMSSMESYEVRQRVSAVGRLTAGLVIGVAGLFGCFRFAARNATDPIDAI